MSAVLLDTHVLVWLVDGDRRLSSRSRRIILPAARTSEVWVSAISVWELAMLVAKGRLALTKDVLIWAEEALRLPGIRLAPIDPAVAVASTRLPGELHGDPADRLIAASARHLGATLITADRKLLAYAAEGHLSAVAA